MAAPYSPGHSLLRSRSTQEGVVQAGEEPGAQKAEAGLTGSALQGLWEGAGCPGARPRLAALPWVSGAACLRTCDAGLAVPAAGWP